MPKIEKPMSPLKNCEKEAAKLIASLVEQFMISSIEMQIELASCKIEQIYKHAKKEERNEQCRI